MTTPFGTAAAAARQTASGYALRALPRSERLTPLPGTSAISENTPLGEWVEAHTIPGDLPHLEELPDVTLGSWAESSFDLLHGTDVSDSPDTVPGDLLDELFSLHDDTAKTRKE